MCMPWLAETEGATQGSDTRHDWQVICEIGKAVGAEGLVAGQIVDIKSEGQAEKVRLSADSMHP